MREIKCPKHGIVLERKKTRYGIRLSCPVPGCTVVCWDGGTSTSADYETRQARMSAHAALDPLWQGDKLPRGYVYKKLSEFMGLTKKETHIGHFNIEQCQMVLEFCGSIHEEQK